MRDAIHHTQITIHEVRDDRSSILHNMHGIPVRFQEPFADLTLLVLHYDEKSAPQYIKPHYHHVEHDRRVQKLWCGRQMHKHVVNPLCKSIRTNFWLCC